MGAAVALSSLEYPYGHGQEYFEQIIGLLDSKEGNSMDMSKLEQELEKRGRELMRILLQEHLNNRSPGTSSEPVRDADGIERIETPAHERKIETVFGRVELNRSGYGEKGCESLHPLDAELNLPPEIYSLELHRRVAEEAAKNSFEEVVETIAKTTGGHVPKRQAEQLVQRAVQDFDAFYDTRKCSSFSDQEPEQDCQSRRSRSDHHCRCHSCY